MSPETFHDTGLPPFVVRRLGRVEYESTVRAMQDFTARRDATTPDELWLVEHPPVFTLGLAGKLEHLLRETEIPVVKTDRGGQVTYHGPGQIVIYLLVDLARRDIKVRQLVTRIEQGIIDFLAAHDVRAGRLAGAPGVYVDGAKIAALGLRVKRGCCYHGMALNADMDLAPFSAINPCGYAGLKVTQLRELGVNLEPVAAGEELLAYLGHAIDMLNP